MIRLTDDKVVKNLNKVNYLERNKAQERYIKLGFLEDIEEYLGCSLDVVFSALQNNIISDNLNPDNIKTIYLRLKPEQNSYLLVIDNQNQKTLLRTKDYSKTWWLRK